MILRVKVALARHRGLQVEDASNPQTIIKGFTVRRKANGNRGRNNTISNANAT